MDKDKLTAYLEDKIQEYQKSYRLAGWFEYGIYAVQAVFVSGVFFISLPAVTLMPIAIMVLLNGPAVALLISPAHKLTRKENLKACMLYYEFMLLRVKMAGTQLQLLIDHMQMFEKNPVFTMPYRFYRKKYLYEV